MDGSNLDLYVYKSESELFHGFKDPGSLVWMKEDVVYGAWTVGPEGDGIFTNSINFPTTHVSVLGTYCIILHVIPYKSS